MLARTRPGAVELAPLNLNALLLRTFDATAPALDARNVRLETELAKSLPEVAGDPDRLQQVFLNLINNALDAMPGGGVLRVRTGVVVAAEGEADLSSNDNSLEGMARNIFVEFADTGGGVAEDLRARIFDPFFTTKEKGHGTGLGLVVARQVAREHGGEIKVEIMSEEGARFRLILPSMKEQAEPEVTTAIEIRL
jgi:signal transduction histidine kinase